jgi:hypothetical protein
MLSYTQCYLRGTTCMTWPIESEIGERIRKEKEGAGMAQTPE